MIGSIASYRRLRGGKWEGWNIADPFHAVIWWRVKDWSETPPPASRGNPIREEHFPRWLAYLLYTQSLLRHIRNVRRMCWHNGLYWQGLVHDWSKWRRKEFVPYAMHFYGRHQQKRDKTGYYKPTDTGDAAFDLAWLHHQKLNPHHWQWWVLPEDQGGVKVLEMPERYVKEMICDWWGASTAYGYKGQNHDWYEANKHKMQLHPNTRAYVEKAIRNSEHPYTLPPL